MTEMEKYRQKRELLRRAIQFADELDQAEAERGTAERGTAEVPAAVERTTTELEGGR